MSAATQPTFIIGSGRSGTRTFFRMLAGTPGLEIHHEYAVHETQKIASQYFMGLANHDTAKRHIQRHHGASIYYSTADTWIDSSNKLTWLIEPLLDEFPRAKLLAVVRDGRKVVPSFYYKLREEMYDDESTKVLSTWLDNRKLPSPPAEKQYWWNIPQQGQRHYDDFKEFNRFQRVAYHWAESNRTIINAFKQIPSDQRMLVRLEDVTTSEDSLKSVIGFLGLKYDETYMEYLRTPRNVFIPLDFQLTREQIALFDPLCADVMLELGYGAEGSYRVRY